MSIDLIQNTDRLLRRDPLGLRRDALSILGHSIAQVVPYRTTHDLVHFDGETLTVGGDRYPLRAGGRIYVVGAGKASFPIALALDEILGAHIADGVVVVKEGETRRLPHLEVFESSHPLPDARSVIAAQKLLKVLQQAGEGDLVLAAITGGASALVNAPASGIHIDELRAVNELLLKCGAAIGKINTVRKHLCALKGGQLVQWAQPATVITLTLDTAPPDMPWPDPCLPDPTTFGDAIEVLQSHGLWQQTPRSVQHRLQEGAANPALETPKSLDGMNHALYSVADPVSACAAAAQQAQALGYQPHILATAFEGEAKDLGMFLAGIADEIQRHGRPFAPPCALLSGGETTVTIHGPCCEGGPNQESALGFAVALREPGPVVFASVDTDGTDGPCAIAGGIVDGHTRARAASLGLHLDHALRQHSAAEALRRLDGDIVTGHTGTNVMNLRVVLIKGETP